MPANIDKVRQRHSSKYEKPKESNTSVSKENEDESTQKEKTAPTYRFGPMPSYRKQRMWCRAIILVGIVVYVWYTSKKGKEIAFARYKDDFDLRYQHFECDKDYLDEVGKYKDCAPTECGRFVTDRLINDNEIDTLLKLAQKAIALGGSSGGASILDLHSGALSYKDKFINIYSLESAKNVITTKPLNVYKAVKNRIQQAIAKEFHIDPEHLHLTHPTFFSKLTSDRPKTIHDEYWHTHIDKETYESFHYTSLLYLSDYGIDFKGGRLIFVDDLSKPTRNITIEPKRGRVAFFSSGAENPHFVEHVFKGVRYAITISFTCDRSARIKDPAGK